MNKRFFLIRLKLLIGLLILMLAIILGEYIYSKTRVPLGLYMGETYIGGMTYEELNNYFEELKENLKKTEAVFSWPQKEIKYTYNLQKLGIYFDQEKTMEEIIRIGKPFNWREKYILLRLPQDITPSFSINNLQLNDILTELKNIIKVELQDAEVWAEGGKLKFRPHRHGTELNKGMIFLLLMDELSTLPVSDLNILLPIEPQDARVTVSSIIKKGIIEEIHTATTYFNPDNENRVHNIDLATKKVNNIIIKPGEHFSFNEIVGEASSEWGYKEAPVIVNQELVMGVGGGICQVSSTLYNAALMSGMTIVERHNHGLPVSYLPPGLDAAVAYDYLDLKFTNELETHVLINAEVETNSLYVTIFGNAAAAGVIEVVREDLTPIPPPEHFRIADGRPSWYRELIQEGKPGYTVEVIRIFYDDHKEIRRESLSKDYYAPVPYIYATGNIPQNNN